MYSILFVCTGNTCRSPMAEGILREMLKKAGVNDVEVSSAGVGTLDGYPVTSYAVKAARVKGADISEHHSTKMNITLTQKADLILSLAADHHEHLANYSDLENKLFMLKAFPEKGHADFAHSIDDPIGGTLDNYMETVDHIERELLRVLPVIITRIKSRQNQTK